MSLSSLSILASSALLIQLGANPGQQQSPKGNIEVAITRFGTGEIVPGARVTLIVQGGAGPRGAVLPAPTQGQAPIPAGARGVIPQPPPIPAGITDSGGKYAFQNLNEGAYMLQVQANGYLPRNYGARYPGGPGVPIRLKAGQTISNVAVSLVPAGNISGRIRDRASQPLINVPIQLLRYSYNAQGQRDYTAVGSTRTNDRGEYRFYWVNPGRYFLMAGMPTSSIDPLLTLMASDFGAITNANQVPVPLGYMYYPGVTDMSAANAIDLQPGADLNGIDLNLPPRPRTFKIRGRVVDSRTGQAPPTASVLASPQAPGASSNSLNNIGSLPGRGYNAAAGTFEVSDLLPGTYTLSASTQDRIPSGGRGTGIPQQPVRLSGSTTVVLSESDVESVVLTIVPATPINGRIRVDGQLPANLTLDRVRLELLSSVSGPPPVYNTAGTAVAKADGTFLFNAVPQGEYRVRLSGQGPTGSLYIKEGRFEGVDIANSPFRVAGPSSSTLEIVVSFSGGRVSGTLTDQRSQPVPVSQVTLIPDRLRNRSDLYRTVTTGEDGRFTILGVAPGDYKLFSWDGIEPYSWFDPNFLAQSETKGHAVHVSETSDEMMEVKIIPAAGVQ